MSGPIHNMSQPVVAIMFESEFDSMVELFRGVQAYAEMTGIWRPVPLNVGEEDLLGELIEHGNLVGVIGALASDRWIESHWLGRMPLINVENLSDITKAPSVVVDDEEVGRMVAKSMIGGGFESYAYAGLTGNLYTILRQNGFVEYLITNGKRVTLAPPGWVTRPLGIWSEWLRSLPRPVGIFCATDYTARRVIQAARLVSLRVPEEISVVGVGNIYRDSLYAGVPIASVELPYFEIGKEAGRQLDDLRYGRLKGFRNTKFSPVRLLERVSSRFDMIEDPVVGRTLDLMRTRYHEVLTIDGLAKQLAVSRRGLEQRFHETLSSSPYRELLKIRMERAKHLLEHSEKKVIEISQLCGFSSQHQFSNSFKRICGISPRDYRIKSTHSGAHD
jgi:LacI family transcriptional regulator